MSNELEFLSRYVAKGKLSRRDFLGRAAALGVTATFANSLLSSAARAALERSELAKVAVTPSAAARPRKSRRLILPLAT